MARRARVPLADPPRPPELPATASRRLGLTNREVDVLRELAAGRSNRQIAQALFISPKTVSVHVSNILRKLGLPGRTQAAEVAHRLALDEPPGAGRGR